MKLSFYKRTTLEWAESNSRLVSEYATKYPQIPIEHIKVILYSNAKNLSNVPVALLLYANGSMKISKSFWGDKFIVKMGSS